MSDVVAGCYLFVVVVVIIFVPACSEGASNLQDSKGRFC